jgi:hypothetical protein
MITEKDLTDFIKTIKLPYRSNIGKIEFKYYDDDSQKIYVYSIIETGGVTGGNYNSNKLSSYTTTDELINQFKIFDLILENYKPDMSFIKYNNFKYKLTVEEHSENEYYGNSTNYLMTYISLEDMVKFLNE